MRFLSLIQDKNPIHSRYMTKIISRDLGREFQVETARGLANEFKLKYFLQGIYSLVINYQRM